MSGRAVPTRGFTMAEVLATLFVIIICSSAVIAVFFTGTRDAIQASDRNAAGLLYPEAQREIEKNHLYTPEMESLFPGGEPGVLVATVANDPETLKENNKTSPYKNVFFYGAEKLNEGPFTLQSCEETAGGDVAIWPPRGASARNIGGGYYRIRYTLEKHPDWVTAFAGGSTVEELCPLRGVYVLTMICYSDNHQDMSSLVQVAQPVVVYLHDRKAR